MKKRTGVERAVIVMAVVVVLLAIALIVVNVADIRIRRPAAGPEAPVETTLPQFPFGDEPELILGSGETPARDAEQAVPVDGENKTMQLVTGSFAQRGGPDFSLYLDKGVFLEHGAGRQVLLCPRGRCEHGRLSRDRLSHGRGCADTCGHAPE